MRRWLIAIVPLFALLLGTITVALAQDATTTVSTRDDATLGTFLTDDKGMTLYMFTKDTANTSNCAGDCEVNWPIFRAEEPLSLPDGVEGKLALFDRADGTKQVTYNEMPLYYFIGDKAAGDTTGQAVGDVWFVVAPGANFESMAATPEASPVAATTTVMVVTDPKLGPILTDAEGKTLYLFTKDTEKGKSACAGDCATNWPAFVADEPLTLPTGVEGALATITLADGSKQVTFNDLPLYYFIGDTKAGDTTGQGVGDVWYVVAPTQKFGEPIITDVD